MVKVTAADGATREKKTEAFVRSGNSAAARVHFTADFEVDLDATLHHRHDLQGRHGHPD